MTYFNNKVFFVSFMLFLLCVALYSSGQAVAQAQNSGDDQLEVLDERKTSGNETKAVVNVNGSVDLGEIKVTELSKAQPQVFTEAEAPSAGPAESIIIVAAITFGFLGAVIFLALVVHDRH